MHDWITSFSQNTSAKGHWKAMCSPVSCESLQTSHIGESKSSCGIDLFGTELCHEPLAKWRTAPVGVHGFPRWIWQQGEEARPWTAAGDRDSLSLVCLGEGRTGHGDYPLHCWAPPDWQWSAIGWVLQKLAPIAEVQKVLNQWDLTLSRGSSQIMGNIWRCQPTTPNTKGFLQQCLKLSSCATRHHQSASSSLDLQCKTDYGWRIAWWSGFGQTNKLVLYVTP